MALPGDVTEILVSVHEVTFDGLSLGFTAEGSTVTIGREIVRVTTDQSGRNVPVTIRVVGVSAVAKLNLMQFNMDNLEKVFEEATRVTDATTPSKEKLTFGELPGQILVGGKLTLHPTQLPTADKSSDIVFHIAVSMEPVELNFNLDTPTMIPVSFEAVYDDTQDDGNKMFLIGDETATS